MLKWIHNFLRNRMQKVVVGSRSSSSFYCTKGVPQGSVLSPLLVNIYVSDLHSMAKENNSSLRSFVDDMTLYHSDTSAEHASKTVCAVLNIINDELVDLGLPINIEKSAALHICPSAKKSNHLPSTPTILLCGTPLNVVTEMRLLGVIVVNQLSWSSQVNSVISKVAKRSAFSEETYISFRLPLAVFSTRQSFNRTLSMQLQQRYLLCPFLCVIASVLCGGGHAYALCRRGGVANRSCPHFEKASFNVNRTSLGTPVCRCRAKMCSKIGSSLGVHKTKFYRTFSSNQGKRKFSSTILSLLSARHALIY